MRDGCEMPLMGLGTYLSDGGDETEQSCLAALASGYRHIDTAQCAARHSVRPLPPPPSTARVPCVRARCVNTFVAHRLVHAGATITKSRSVLLYTAPG
jgi:hypothetical protein